MHFSVNLIFPSCLWTNLTVHGNKRFASPFACCLLVGAWFFLGYFFVVKTHNPWRFERGNQHRSSTHWPGRVRQCGRPFRASCHPVRAGRWRSFRAQDEPWIAAQTIQLWRWNLVCVYRMKGGWCPENVVQFGAKLQKLQLLQFGYRFFFRHHPVCSEWGCHQSRQVFQWDTCLHLLFHRDTDVSTVSQYLVTTCSYRRGVT